MDTEQCATGLSGGLKECISKENLGGQAGINTNRCRTNEPEKLCASGIRKLIPAALCPQVICLEKVDSTNLEAKRAAAQGAPHGTVILAEEQSAGRGRRGRSWVSKANGGLYLSMILRPPVPPEEAPKMTLGAAVVVEEAIEEVCGLCSAIKWPNDLLLGEKKLCGILTEICADVGHIEYIVVGIGINANQEGFSEELQPTATSLRLERKEKIDINRLAAAVIGKYLRLVKEWTESGDFEPVMERYRAHSCTLGQEVRVFGVNETLEGTAEDIFPDGMLLLRTAEGQLRKLSSGDVSLRKKISGHEEKR